MVLLVSFACLCVVTLLFEVMRCVELLCLLCKFLTTTGDDLSECLTFSCCHFSLKSVGAPEPAYSTVCTSYVLASYYVRLTPSCSLHHQRHLAYCSIATRCKNSAYSLLRCCRLRGLQHSGDRPCFRVRPTVDTMIYRSQSGG